MSRRKASGPASGMHLPSRRMRCAISTGTASGPAITERFHMAVIAEPVATKHRSRFRFILDRRDVLGAIFVSPAILYVLLLVGMPFLLAVYYSPSFKTIYDRSSRFVGLAKRRHIIQTPVFIARLGNT